MYKHFFKRIFDCLFALILLIPLLPIMLLIAIAIKLDSKGPAIFKQVRSGKDNKEFMLYKFRSMTANNDFYDKSKEDQLTKVGAFIRKTSLDELPQLMNILKGDMSLVGPRPCTEREYELYTERDKLRLKVPQGLTGEWQVRGRSDTSFKSMVDMDLDYIQNKRGFWYDIGILFRTIPAFLFRKGAR